MKNNFFKIESKDVKNNLINLRQLVFEVTDACNLNCKYCGYGELYEGYDARKCKNLTLNKAKNIIRYLAELWEKSLAHSINQPLTLSFYGGEPLLNIKLVKDIIEFTESLNITRKKIHYSMTTNALLLGKHMDFIAEKEFRLLISLDGTEQNHSYRVDHNGNNSHKIVVENVQLLKQKYPGYFEKHVRFNSVLHNRSSVDSAYRYIYETFGKKNTISTLNNAGIKPEKVDAFYKMFQNADKSIGSSNNREALEKELFLEAPRVSQLTGFISKHSGNMYANYRSLFNDEKNVVMIPTGTCTPFSKKIFVTVNGKILACEKINHEYAYGQVFDNSVEIDLDKIAATFNDYVYKFVKQCESCASILKCSQCVFQIDDLKKKNLGCKGFISPKVFQKYVERNLDYLGQHPTLYKKIMQEVRIEN